MRVHFCTIQIMKRKEVTIERQDVMNGNYGILKKEMEIDKLKKSLREKVRCYHKNYSEKHLSSLSLEALYRNMHPTDRAAMHAEIKKYVDNIKLIENDCELDEEEDWRNFHWLEEPSF